MSEEITAKIIIEDGGSKGGGGASPKQRERDKVQKDIAKRLEPVSKFFGGGEIKKMASGLGGIGKLIGGGIAAILGGAIAGGATGIGLIGGLDLSFEKDKKAFADTLTDEENEAREEVIEALEDNTDTAKTLEKAEDNLVDATDDVKGKFGEMVDDVKQLDFLELRDDMVEFVGEVWNGRNALIDFIKALGADTFGGTPGAGSPSKPSPPPGVPAGYQDTIVPPDEAGGIQACYAAPYFENGGTPRTSNFSLKSVTESIGSFFTSIFD